MASGTRSTSRPRRNARWAAWPATIPAAAARSATATWCTTWPARRHPGRRHARALRRQAARGHAARGARHRRQSGSPCRRRAGRDRAHVPQGAAARGGLQSRHLLPAVGASLHDRQLGQHGASAGGQRRHAGGDRAADAQAVAIAQAQGAGRRELPELLQGDGVGAAYREAEAHRRRAGGSHDDRAGARQPGLPTGDRAGAHRQARGDPAGRVRGRGARGADRRPQATGRADGRSRHAGQRRRDGRARPAGRALGSAQGRPQHHDVDEGRW